MNPVEKFLKEKNAGFMSTFGSSMKKMPDALGHAAAQGVTTAVAGAGVAGMGLAVSKIYDAMTKKRDFHQMLEANPDLMEHHNSDPKRFNQMFSSLRLMNPAFSADPIVAGTYMRRMVESPLTAGGVAVESLGHRESAKSPMVDAFMRGGMEGSKRPYEPGPEQESKKPSP